MIDRPYTDVAVRIVVEALATTAFAQTLEDDAHAVLAALAAEGLLVTPRIEQDIRMLGRAYIWRRPGAEPLVLNPIEVEVVLPLGGSAHPLSSIEDQTIPDPRAEIENGDRT